MNHSDLVLIGGGHTHVLLIRSLAMRSIPGVRVTLVSEKTLTPYSGMLPGFVAGHYSLAQTSIDLNRLCQRVGVRWIKATVIAVAPEERQVVLADQASLGFDQLSIDIGSTPDLGVKGAREFATGVKPIANFQQRWNALLEQSVSHSNDASSTVSGDWGVIGAGAGGVELVLAMAHRLRNCPDLRFHLIYRGARVLPGYPAAVAAIVERRLRDYGVTRHPNFSVTEVTAHSVLCATGKQVDLTESIWCTGARGAAWPASSGLATTEKGFISVNRYLQSTSHPSIFAAGDIAEMIDDPRPKAGVYAVRQALPLEQNLRRVFAGQPLRVVKLQTRFLSLLSLGDREAVASRNGLVVKGRWVWRWKDSIDQKFMRQFAALQASMDKTNRTNPSADDSKDLMHCGGCGSKLGPGLLMHNLKQVGAAKDALKKGEGITIAADVMAEDASVWTPTAGTLSVQSIDGFRSFTTDEYRFGRICANHALSDIYAMGATVTYAQAWINLTFSHPRIQQRDHLRMLQGIVDALSEQGAELTGGHSSEGAETHLAIVANGELMPAAQWTKAGVQPGDVLVLSKGLGTGVILAADMQGEAQAAAVDVAYASMLQGNDRSMQQLQGFSPHAVTDVTGFGLLGHLLEMLDSTAAQAGTKVGAVLDLTAIPLLFGARELATAGWRSSLYPQLKPYLDRCSLSGGLEGSVEGGLNQHNADQTFPVEINLLLDPQTSGGLLASMTESEAKAMLATETDFVAIGRIELSAGDASVRF